jgi:hypothetical protein
MTKTTYAEKPIANWTTNDFIAYITARHLEVYGVEYRPFRSWSAERGLIGGLIGTRQKPRKYEPELVKAFVDECFRSHKGTREYPGVSFSWLWTYKSNIWQKTLADNSRKSKTNTQDLDSLNSGDLLDWL